jgi:hypothetical protein
MGNVVADANSAKPIVIVNELGQALNPDGSYGPAIFCEPESAKAIVIINPNGDIAI